LRTWYVSGIAKGMKSRVRKEVAEPGPGSWFFPMYCAQEHLDEDFRGQGVGGKATLRLDGKKRLIMRKNTSANSQWFTHTISLNLHRCSFSNGKMDGPKVW
jgi:hypothetical protein